MFPAGAGQLSRGPPPFWVGWCFSGVFGVWIRWLRTSSCCSSSCCGPIEPGQRVAAISKLVDTKLKGRKPPILLVLNTIVSPYLPLFLILPRRITYHLQVVKIYFRVKAKKIWRKTAIHDWRDHGSSTGRARCKNPCHHKPQKRGDFITGVWEFVADWLPGPVRNLCQALFVHRLWITTGVWEFVGFC